MPPRTHLTAIEDACRREPNAPAFRIPRVDSTDKIWKWASISYQEFRGDILAQATTWTRLCGEKSIARGSVITLWLKGMSYADVVLIYGVSRAGYIPQLISANMPSEDAVFDMSQRASSRLLVCDSALQHKLEHSPIPVHLQYPVTLETAEQCLLSEDSLRACEEGLPSLEELARDMDAPAFILHTSGSTSGQPKLVPWTYDWVDFKIERMDGLLPPRAADGGQAVYAWMGSACHGGQMFVFLGAFKNASCMIQCTSVTFSSDELVDMVQRCNLSTLIQFPPLFSLHLKRAREDPKVLQALQSLDSATLVGMPLPQDDLEWCITQNIPVRLGFGSTECGTLLVTIPGRPPLYRPVDSTLVTFLPIEQSGRASASCASDSQTDEKRSSRLVELVVPSNSRECPAPALRSTEDGHFHTGDLFEEVEPGVYASRGRADDWILLSGAGFGRCDTKAVENNVMQTCSGLITACVVTGYLRPLIVLFVEVDESSPMLGADFKEQLLRRIQPTQEKLWDYERLRHARQIFVVLKGALPRTAIKGNVRRKAVEEVFRNELDALYESELRF